MQEQKHIQLLNAMGVDVWQQRDIPQAQQTTSDQVIPSTCAEQMPAATATLNWEELEARVKQCIACPLHKTRTQTVFGIGNRQADLMLIGEAPGATEDKMGQPFVGRAGQLLDAMLRAIKLHRDQIFIANILKCRPPGNRDPNQAEMQECTPYLERQVALIQPKLIVALGRISAHYLLNTTTPLGRLRNQIHHFGDSKIPLLATYHPAYLLRNPSDKRKAWEDLQRIQELLTNFKKD